MNPNSQKNDNDGKTYIRNDPVTTRWIGMQGGEERRTH